MKKILILILCLVFVCGCTKTEDSIIEDTSNGPIVSEDTLSDEEKIFNMIVNCITDYNEKDINDLRDYYKSDIPDLPVEISSLPEISSLEDLEEVTVDDDSNIYYCAKYTVNDKYDVIFEIYYPSGSDFWPNGDVRFEIDKSLITENDPAYSTYREELTYLLSEESSVIDALYGSSATLNEESSIDERYYEVISIGDKTFTSIEEIKEYAESVFTYDYLEENYYPNAFYAETPIYKESGSKLYCLQTEVTSLVSNAYSPEYIIAVKEEDSIIRINLLTKVMDQVLSEIKEIKITETENGYRLVNAG